MKKVFVFGIDGAMPEKVFGEWLDELPNIKKLMEQGCYAKLNSTIPPLSIVAWTSITTGKNPMDHGIFECLYRKKGSYEFSELASSKNVKDKTIWEIASEHGKKSISCFIPITWPIKPYGGLLLSGFMTPLNPSVEFAYPSKLKTEINSLLGKPLLIDVPNFREFSKEDLLKQIYKMTEMYLDSMEYLVRKKEWDFFIGVINGSDRVNHSFWRYCDQNHRKYDPNSQFKDSLKNYYKFIDQRLGRIISSLDEDTLIIVLSDHGINRMHNRVNLSDWLIKEGYLVLKEGVEIKEPCKLENSMIDWEKTKVFINGFLEAQIYINLEGREPQGIVKQEDYNKLLDELEEKLKKIPGDDGKILNTKFFRKFVDLKGKFGGAAPDMFVYFDNLQYGCNPSKIGNPTLWSPSTAKWSDDSGHSRQGIFIMKNSNQKGDIGEVSYLDIVPTILNKLGLEVPKEFLGKVID
tara:strand:- start:3174 stop:4562 length:1389 start_codon:yes stop_codon:yes gene_type:complete